MPEGDTIHRAARTLQRVLAGKIVEGLRSPLAAFAGAGLTGRRIESVEARGKNLLIHFDDGRAVQSHMRMTGSWHVYRPGERWQRSPGAARLVIEVAGFVAVCFSAPVVELVARGGLHRHATLSRLGPDILGADFDPEEARSRLREMPDAEIGDALLSQQALAGIGNIYKSETLFLCGCDPFARVAELDDATLLSVIVTARDLMSANLDTTVRTIRTEVGGGRNWVYRRRGRACHRCGTGVAMRRQGLAARSTYYCPRCQAPSGRSPGG